MKLIWLVFVRVWSAVLVQVGGWARVFQPSMKTGILVVRSRTEVTEVDEVHPRWRGRGEVRVDAGVRLQPVTDLGALVGGVVVHHQGQLAGGVSAGHLAQER